MAIPQKIINPAPFSQQNIKKNRYLKKVINYLEKVNLELKGRDKAKYEIIKHRTVYTAFDKAATLRVSQKIIGKTLVVKLDKNPALVLVPANKNLDKQKLKKIAKAKSVDFLKEAWMKKNLKGVKLGAVPPFGLQPGHHPTRKMPTFADKTLLKEQKIIVNAGDYNFSIKITPANLKKLTPNLVIGNFSKHRK